MQFLEIATTNKILLENVFMRHTSAGSIKPKKYDYYLIQKI
jgi:hypothetical protein